MSASPRFGEKVPLIRQGSGGEGSCVHPSTVQLTSVVAPSSQPSESLGSRQCQHKRQHCGGLTGHMVAGPFGIKNCVSTPETVEAQVSFDSSVKITVKSDTATTMQVSVTDLPSAVVQVSNWQ